MNNKMHQEEIASVNGVDIAYHWGNLVKNIDSASFDTHPDWL